MNMKSSDPMAKRPKIRPDWKFAVSNPLHFFAVGFGSGLAWVSPGTFGTLMGWLLYIWIDPFVDNTGWALIIVTGFLAGIPVCSAAGRSLGVVDHGSIVWDEIVAIWLVLWVAGQSYPGAVGQLICVLAFRFFDIVKPPPIRWFDQRFKSGFGVMLDDLVAAGMTLLALALWAHFF